MRPCAVGTIARCGHQIAGAVENEQAAWIEIEADLIAQSEFVHALQNGDHLKVAMPGVNVGLGAVNLGKFDLRRDQATVLVVTHQADVASPHAHAIVRRWQCAHVRRKREGHAGR